MPSTAATSTTTRSTPSRSPGRPGGASTAPRPTTTLRSSRLPSVHLRIDQTINLDRLTWLDANGEHLSRYTRRLAEAFGVPIARKQAIAFMLAEMAIEIDATRLAQVVSSLTEVVDGQGHPVRLPAPGRMRWTRGSRSASWRDCPPVLQA